MQHIEEAGIHSGDSACVIPPHSLPPAVVDGDQPADARAGPGTEGQGADERAVRRPEPARAGSEATGRMSGIRPLRSRLAGIYVLEVNPRASRTVPVRVQGDGRAAGPAGVAGDGRQDAGRAGPVRRGRCRSISRSRRASFPFNKFPGVDIILGPEMRSTGEVMGIDDSFPMAFAKSQMAASSALPLIGDDLHLSVADRDKAEAIGGGAGAGGDGLRSCFPRAARRRRCGRPGSRSRRCRRSRKAGRT